MFTRTVHQATAFTLAAIFTLGILGSINLLATEPAHPGLIATGSSTQHVVTTPQAPRV